MNKHGTSGLLLILLVISGCQSTALKEQVARFQSICPHCQDATPKIASRVRTVGTDSVAGGKLLNRAVHIKCPKCGKKYVANNQKVIRESMAVEILVVHPSRLPLGWSVTNQTPRIWESFAIGTTRTNYPASPTNSATRIHGRAGKVEPRVYVQPTRHP